MHLNLDNSLNSFQKIHLIHLNSNVEMQKGSCVHYYI